MFTYTHNQPYHILPYRTSRRVVSKHAYGSALREREREKDRQTDTHTHTHTHTYVEVYKQIEHRKDISSLWGIVYNFTDYTFKQVLDLF